MKLGLREIKLLTYKFIQLVDDRIKHKSLDFKFVQLSPLLDFPCCSEIKSCPTLCDPTDCIRPGFSVLHCLLEFAQIHVQELVMLYSHLILCFPLLLLTSIFASIRAFSNESAICFQSMGASASGLPMNIQSWFPLGLTHLISLLSKELSRVYLALQFESISSSTLSLYGPTLTSGHDPSKNYSFDCENLCHQSDISAS